MSDQRAGARLSAGVDGELDWTPLRPPEHPPGSDPDKRFRDVQPEAVALCTGTAPGQSDYAFGQFDDALGRTLGINQDHFDGTVARAFSGLRPLPFVSVIAALLIVLLTWLGIAPRLREYQG